MTITVERSLGGIFGAIEVFYRTLNPGELYPFLPGGISRAGETDFITTNGSVLLEPGQTVTHFNVSIVNDVLPEIDESLFVILTNVELYSSAQSTYGEILW